jgi:hypothetical protein
MALTLPPGWANYTPTQKINWFNANGVTPDDLASAGVTADEIDWMLANGLKDNPSPEIENKVSASAAQELKTQADQAYATRIEDLAEDLGVPKFVVANYVNQGLANQDIVSEIAENQPTSAVAQIAQIANNPNATVQQKADLYNDLQEMFPSRSETDLISLINTVAGTQKPEDLRYLTDAAKVQSLATSTDPNAKADFYNELLRRYDPTAITNLFTNALGKQQSTADMQYLMGLAQQRQTAQTELERQRLADQAAAERQQTAINEAQGYRGTLEGVPGVDFKGSTGLREAYGPYALDYLSRASALLGMRDAEDYQPMKFGTGYGTETAQALKDLQTQRANMMGMGTGANATPAYQPYQYSFTPKSAKSGGIMSLIEGYADGGMTGTQVVPTAFTAPTGTYQQATYNPTQTAGYVAPGTYQAGTIGSGFDATKVDTYTAPTGAKAITSTFAPSGLYDAGTIGSEFDINKTGVYTAPTGKDAIQSAYTTPTNMYTAGNIGSTYDPNTGLYSGPGTGITTETFDAEALQRLMSPYTSGVVDPQVREAKRQAEIARQAQAARMTRSGAFGGSRQAIAESELGRNLATQIGDIYGKGQQGAFDAALRAFEAEQGRKLQASTATETARQEAGRQALTGEQAKTGFSLQAQTAQEAARQAAGQQALSAAQTAGQLGLQAQTAQEAAKQAAGQQALSAAQTAGQLGLQAQTAQEAARQAAGQQALSAAQTAGQLGLQAQTAQEAARQAAGQQSLSAAEIAGRLGLQGSELTERSRQFAAQYGLQSAQSAAQYEQQARELQQRAEEAQARGDQFGASLALQQLQEAQRAAEASRAFEYQQARDTYLDPYRELGYASQLLQGLPVSAGATGISPATEAIISMLGLGNVLGVGNTTKTTTTPSDRRLKTDIQTIGVLGDGLKVYSYRYKSGGPVHIGVMADEVAVLRPQAYIKGGAGDGFDAVDYSKL